LLIDSDFQFDPKDVWKILAFKNDYDIVLGRKVNRKDGFFRNFLSNSFNFILRKAFNVCYRDMDSGLRLFNRKSLEQISEKVEILKFFTAEFVIRAHYKGFKIKEVDVEHFSRVNGKSRVFSFPKILFVIIRELLAIFYLKYDFFKDSKKYENY
jgi:hypothetical protein